MADSKRIVCLANSRKLSGRCIAGRELSVENRTGSWIRPVSARENQEVSEHERQYEDGSDPQILDIIDVPVLHTLNNGYQTENWLLDPQLYWTKIGSYPPLDLMRLTDPVTSLWNNGKSSYNGLNDRVLAESVNSISSSLRLIRVKELELAVFSPGEAFGNPKRRVQGQFVHSSEQYKLWVTDPEYEKKYLAKPDDNYKAGKCYLTISLGEPYEGFCYKLIATIIEV